MPTPLVLPTSTGIQVRAKLPNSRLSDTPGRVKMTAPR